MAKSTVSWNQEDYKEEKQHKMRKEETQKLTEKSRKGSQKQ